MPKIWSLSARFTEWAHFMVWKWVHRSLKYKVLRLCSPFASFSSWKKESLTFSSVHLKLDTTKNLSIFKSVYSKSLIMKMQMLRKYTSFSKNNPKQDIWGCWVPSVCSVRIEPDNPLFLPVEQGWAAGNGREAIASLKWEGLRELQEGAGGRGSWKVGFRDEDWQRERGMAGGRLGELTCRSRGQSSPLSPLKTHLSPPYWSRGEIFVFITAGLLQGLQLLPTCLFLVCGPPSHLSGCN